MKRIVTLALTAGLLLGTVTPRHAQAASPSGTCKLLLLTTVVAGVFGLVRFGMDYHAHTKHLSVKLHEDARVGHLFLDQDVNTLFYVDSSGEIQIAPDQRDALARAILLRLGDGWDYPAQETTIAAVKAFFRPEASVLRRSIDNIVSEFPDSAAVKNGHINVEEAAFIAGFFWYNGKVGADNESEWLRQVDRDDDSLLQILPDVALAHARYRGLDGYPTVEAFIVGVCKLHPERAWTHPDLLN